MPITPRCQFSLPRTSRRYLSSSFLFFIFWTASFKIFSSILCLVLFNSFNFLTSSAHSSSESEKKSFRASSVSPSRPAALILGPTLKPRSTSLISRLPMPDICSKLFSPGVLTSFNLPRPCLTRIRFSPCRLATSATVPILASFRKRVRS